MSIPITWWASKKYVYVKTLLERLETIIEHEDAQDDYDYLQKSIIALHDELVKAE